MEVRPGYKQTEAGVIPEDWDVTRLSPSLASSIQNGLFNEPLRKGRGSRLINVIDLYGRFPIDTSPLERFDANTSELLKFGVQRGDVFFTRSSLTPAGIAQCNVVADDAGQSIVFDSHVIRVRVDSGKVDPFFLARYCASHNARRFLVANAKTTTMTTIDQSVVASLLVALPPLPEQRGIAAALSDVDALLAGLDRLIAKKRDLKQAAMQQLLTGQTRLPGFSGEWEVMRLEDIGDIRSGGTPSTAQARFWDGDVHWCTPTDITRLDGRKYLTETARTISAAGLQSSSAEVIPSRSLIMTSRATIGECAINLTPMTTNQGFKNIVPFAHVDVEFLYYLMTTQKPGLIALCGGSTFLEIGKKQLSAYEITLPKDRVEQSAIAAVLSDMDAELAALEARRDKTRDLKQAMMQELLTGKTRLVSPEVAHA